MTVLHDWTAGCSMTLSLLQTAEWDQAMSQPLLRGRARHNMLGSWRIGDTINTTLKEVEISFLHSNIGFETLAFWGL